MNAGPVMGAPRETTQVWPACVTRVTSCGGWMWRSVGLA
jgi:hypothetical protein